MTWMQTAQGQAITSKHIAQPCAAPAAQRRRIRWPRPIWFFIVLARFIAGYITFTRTGRTPIAAYDDMRRLFRLTNGRFNACTARLFALRHPPRAAFAPGIFNSSAGELRYAVIPALRRDGLYRFSARLDRVTCERLRQFALAAPCTLEPAPTPAPGSAPARATYDPRQPRATRYVIDHQRLHEHTDVQRLMLDPSILAMARAYLRCEPVLIGSTMWWSTAWKPGPCDAAAQRYHFDMSQLSFVKLFIYLSDVDRQRGPHMYVLGSHRQKPEALLADRRYDDDEVLACYPADRVVCLTGKAGSIFAEDTSGFHKGLALETGERLILELLFASSAFGEQHEPIELNDAFTPDFRAAALHSPRLLQRFR